MEPEFDYAYDMDGDEIKREVLLDVDASEPGDYVVQVWVYRCGFEDVKQFATKEVAFAYAIRKSAEKGRRYRVLGPEVRE